MPDTILAALTNAVDRLDQPAVYQAYQQLAHILGVALTGQPFDAEQPLTPTQLVLIRHALQRLSPAQMTTLNEAAEQLQGSTTINNISGGTVVQQNIGTVSGGSVMMIGINHGETPSVPPQPAPVSLPVALSHDVFISYSRKDSATARRVYADLRSAGLMVWMDDQLKPGDPSWQKAIEKAIRASGCVVAILTPSAKASEWIEREISMAQTHHVTVVPLLMSGDEASSIPLSLCNIQWTAMRNPREYRANLQKLITAIRELNA